MVSALPPSVVLVAAVTATAGLGALIDLRTRRVPNWLTAGTTALGVALAGLQIGAVGLGGAAAGFVAGLLLMLPGYVIAQTGAGDVKLVAAVGTLLGPRLTLIAFVYTAIAGGLLAIGVALYRRRLRASIHGAAALVATAGANATEIESPSRNNGFAYAPAIAIGALIAAIGG